MPTWPLNGKCVGVFTVDRLKTLLKAFGAARRAGIHATIQPPLQDSATEIMGLLYRQKAQQRDLSAKSKELHNFNTLIAPPHIRSVLQKWCMVSTERFSNTLEFDGTYNNYFSTNCHDHIFGVCTDAFSVRYCGFSFCHPPHEMK
eukprot:1138527-Pelagomonas_calceolata.AAC.1